jgi:hypothetical protein
VLHTQLVTENHKKIIENNIKLYLCNQLKNNLKADNGMVYMFRQMFKYLTESLDIKGHDQQQDLATRLVDGLVGNTCKYVKDVMHLPKSFHLLDFDCDLAISKKLLAAVAVGAGSLVTSLIRLKPQLMYQEWDMNYSFGYPLEVAVRQSDMGMVRTLIHACKEAGMDLHESLGTLPQVSQAMNYGNMEMMKLLIQASKPLHQSYKSRGPGMGEHWTFLIGVAKPLKEWYNPPGEWYNIWTSNAIRLDSAVALDSILESKSQDPGILKERVVLEMCGFGSNMLLSHYIRNGLDPNAVYGIKSPLIAAVERGRMDNITILLAAGADINKITGHGNTALLWAARIRNEEIVRYLIDQGADTSMVGWPDTQKVIAAKKFMKKVLDQL